VPKVDEEDLLRWREMQTAHLLSKLADYAKRDMTFVPMKSKETQRWVIHASGRDYELLTNGSKFYDTRAERGGGGAIDLVIYLFRLDFNAAVALLRRHGA
jgi:hypothetical protein